MKRRTLITTAVSTASILAGCTASGFNDADTAYQNREDFSINEVEVQNQATRAGVQVTIASDPLSSNGENVPLKVTLYNQDGETIKEGYLLIGVKGGESATKTVWFEFDSVEAANQAFRANVEIVPDEEYQNATGESPQK